MPHPDLSLVRWRKSSHSGGNGGACVELALLSGLAAIRDSKNITGPTLVLGQAELACFLFGIRAGGHPG